MSANDDDSIGALLSDLVRTLQALEAEVQPRTDRGRPRPPSLAELLRFTSDVTIPAAILVLRTNIEALKLLRRALRMADGRPSGAAAGEGTNIQQRATDISRVTLSRLDDALADIQAAVEGKPTDDEASDLLAEARQLRADLADAIEAQTERDSPGTGASDDGTTIPVEEAADDVAVDVDAELRSIKDDLDAAAGDDDGGGDADDGEAPGESGEDDDAAGSAGEST